MDVADPDPVPDTVTAAVRFLEAQGFSSDFEVSADGVHCGACGTLHAPVALEVVHRFRFEGPTDPADEAVVLGVRCPTCGALGIVVSAYGPDADDALLELVRERDRPEG